MKKAVFECEVVTPMFMAGADRNKVELRPSEFKGMMRFWWRAASSITDISELKKEESFLFGASEKGIGKGKINIRLKYNKQELEKLTGRNLKQDYRFDWKYDKVKRFLDGAHSGIGYLLYSVYKEKEYMKPGLKFDIEISSNTETELLNALASFWIALYLGGFGARSRRGAGSVRVTRIKKGNNFLHTPNFITEAKEASSLLSWIKDNVILATDIILKGRNKRFISSYPNIYFSRLKISEKGFLRWEDALNELGKHYNGFRYEHRIDSPENGVFGLPVVHSNRKKTIAIVKKRKIQRHASPLIFKILQAHNRYYWMMLRLMGEFLPEGGILSFDKNRQKRPSYEIIDDFWNSVPGIEEILLIPDELNKLKEDIIKEAEVEKIYVFGSRARGDFHRRSDLDIAVKGKFIEKIDIVKNFDLVNLNKVGDSLRERIKREGVLIYGSKDHGHT